MIVKLLGYIVLVVGVAVINSCGRLLLSLMLVTLLLLLPLLLLPLLVLLSLLLLLLLLLLAPT